MLHRVIDWAMERGWLEYGPYDQLAFTERTLPGCVAVMVALMLLAAYVEGGTVTVP